MRNTQSKYHHETETKQKCLENKASTLQQEHQFCTSFVFNTTDSIYLGSGFVTFCYCTPKNGLFCALPVVAIVERLKQERMYGLSAVTEKVAVIES